MSYSKHNSRAMVKTSVTDIIDHQNNPSVTTEDWYDNLTLNCWQVELAPYARMMLPSVWSSLFSVNKQAFGTLVSLFILIFFSPSNKRNDSKAGGAFMMNIANTTQPAAADCCCSICGARTSCSTHAQTGRHLGRLRTATQLRQTS